MYIGSASPSGAAPAADPGRPPPRREGMGETRASFAHGGREASGAGRHDTPQRARDSAGTDLEGATRTCVAWLQAADPMAADGERGCGGRTGVVAHIYVYGASEASIAPVAYL